MHDLDSVTILLLEHFLGFFSDVVDFHWFVSFLLWEYSCGCFSLGSCWGIPQCLTGVPTTHGKPVPFLRHKIGTTRHWRRQRTTRCYDWALNSCVGRACGGVHGRWTKRRLNKKKIMIKLIIMELNKQIH